MAIWPETGTQGLGAAIQEASPLLMAMSQGLLSGQGAMANAPAGLAAMMQAQDKRAQEEAKRRELQQLGGVLGGMMGGGGANPAMSTSGTMTHGPGGAFGDVYGQPGSSTYGPANVAMRNQAMAQQGGPTNAAASQLAGQDRELLAKTLMAEAGGEGLRGMLAAGNVMNNRLKSGNYGDTLRDVIMAPGQFSAWNSVTGYAGGEGGLDMANMQPSEEAYRAADMLLSGQAPDITGGATHYYNPSVANPAWGQQAGGNWTQIGAHVFGSADGRPGAGGSGGTMSTQGQAPQQAQQQGGIDIDPQRLAQIVLSPNIPDSTKQVIMNRAFPTPQGPVNWQRFEGTDGGIYAFNPVTRQTVPIQAPVEQEPDLSAAEEQINRIMETGVDRNTAIRIRDGVYGITRDPITGVAQVIDKATGEIVQGAQPQQAPQQQQAPAQAPSAAPQEQQQPALSFPGVQGNAEEAFGVGGALRGTANTLADIVGAPVPYEGAQTTQSDFDVLRESMLNDIASAYGRQPPSWLMQEIRKLTPEAGSPFQGAQGAQSKLQALRRNFENELQLAEEQARRRQSPTQQQETESRILGLQNAIGRVDGALQRFGGQAQGGGTSGVTSSGIEWSLE